MRRTTSPMECSLTSLSMKAAGPQSRIPRVSETGPSDIQETVEHLAELHREHERTRRRPSALRTE